MIWEKIQTVLIKIKEKGINMLEDRTDLSAHRSIKKVVERRSKLGLEREWASIQTKYFCNMLDSPLKLDTFEFIWELTCNCRVPSTASSLPDLLLDPLYLI